jgi:hypothetical protein
VTAVKTKLDCESSGRILVSTVSETKRKRRERPLTCAEGTPANGGEAMGRRNRCLRGYFREFDSGFSLLSHNLIYKILIFSYFYNSCG